jgi:hypothetical protein
MLPAADIGYTCRRSHQGQEQSMTSKYRGWKNWGRLGAVLAAAVVAGCASTPPDGPVDLQRLGQAVTIDDVRYVRALVDAHAIDVNQGVPGIGYASTPMITSAARNGSLDMLRYLISAHANLNARTPDRDTAIMLAAHFADEDRERMTTSTMRYDQAVRMLAEAGASLENVESNAYTALSYAAYAGRDTALTYLIEKGAKVNGEAQGRTAYVATPLMMAAMQGNRNATLQLLRAGADPNIRVQNGMTALEFARKNKQSQLENVLRCAESVKPSENFRQRCE